MGKQKDLIESIRRKEFGIGGRFIRRGKANCRQYGTKIS